MAHEHTPQTLPPSQSESTSLTSNRENGLHLQLPSHSAHDRALEDDTSDDNGYLTNGHLDDAHSIASDADASSIVGVSIGHVQSAMKSPSTPATRKAQALEESKTYFGIEDDGQNHQFEEPVEDLAQENQASTDTRASDNRLATDSSRGQDSTTSTDGKKHAKHSSLVGSILGTATSNNGTRQRSSSASQWLDSIRKILPSMPSITPGNSSSAKKSEPDDSATKVLGPAGPGSVRKANIASTDTQRPSKRGIEAAENGRTTQPEIASTESNAKSAESTISRQPSRPLPLRRVTSDQSLYIRRAPTGASQFDDYNNFADVSDMVNSRFKAITDSFQDSALRLPRLSWGNGSNSNGTDTKLTNTTTDNTKTNTGLSREETLAAVRKGESTLPHSTPQSRHPNIKGALSQMYGDLVILGGYRGSVLREAQPPNRQLWVPVKVGLNLRKADLEVGLTREDELKMEETIIADGTLSHIGPVDICRRLIKKCRKCPNVKDGNLRVHDYGYDWRLSPDLLADRYIAFLESLPCNQKQVPQKERGAWIIAHSLGGLITRNVVNRRPDLFAGVVYAGTPQNCVNILGPLRNGDDVLFSSRVLTAQVNFTLRTSYALLPEDGRCFINKQTGERYDINFFDVKNWEDYHLSPCIKAALRRNKPDKRHSILSTSTDTSTLSSRYTSWFGSSPKNDSQGTESTPQKLKDKVVDAKDDMVDKAGAEENKMDSPFNPSLSDAQHQRPSVATAVTIPLPVATEYLDRTLTSVLKFKQSLVHDPQLQQRNAYPPVAVLFAKNTPTVYGAFVESRESIKYDDAFDELAFAAGDGVVLASAAQLPTGYRCVRGGRVESERGHVGLLGDIEGVGRCLGAIVEARRRGVGAGAHEPQEARTVRS